MDQAPNQTRQRTSSGFSGWLIWLLLSLLLYLLTIGPAAKLSDRGVLSFNGFLTIYAPVLFVANHFHPFKVLVASYLALWDTALWID